MRRTLPLVALTLLLALPLASAQAPDPAALVEQACALAGEAGGRIPLCPQEEPAAPQQAQEAAQAEAHEHAAPEAAQEGAQRLADEGAGTVQGIVEEPASAPDRAVAFLATVLQFLKDLLSLPVAGAVAVGGWSVDAFSAVADATARGAAFVGDAATGAAETVGSFAADAAGQAGALAAGAWDAVAGLFAPAPEATDPSGPLPPRTPSLDAGDATGLLDRALGALPAA